MIRLLASSLIAATLVAVAPASAEPLPTAKVAYADLNLATPAGQKTLERRVNGAIDKVCPDPGHADMETVMDWEQCRIAARVSARNEVATLIDHATRLASNSGATQLASR